MASLRQRGGKIQIRFRDKRREPAEVVFSFTAEHYSARDIRALKKELEVLHERGEWDPWSGRLPGEVEAGRSLTVAEAVERYCEHKRQMGQRRQRGGWTEVTYTDRRFRLMAFARQAGEHRPVASLRTADLAAYIHDDDVAPDTQATRRRMLKTWASYLVAEGLAQLLLPPAMVQPETLGTYCTEAELEIICRTHLRLLEERQNEKHVPKSGPSAPMARAWMCDAWRVAFYQGLRRGELLAMRAGALDLRNGLMAIGDKSFIPKDKREHVIALTPPAAAILAPLLEGKKPTDRVWPSRAPKQITNAFKEAADKAIEKGDISAEKAGLHLHNLRDSGCMYWLEKGVDVLHVRDLLRHKDLKTTLKHYYHVNAARQSEAFRKAFERGTGTPKPDPEKGPGEGSNEA